MEKMTLKSDSKKNRCDYLYEKYSNIMDVRNDPVLKSGVIDVHIHNIHPSKLDYGEAAEYVLMVSVRALKISQSYNKEDFIAYCDMREATIKNFSYKLIKYLDAIMEKALPYRLGVSYFILERTSKYALLYQAFYKMAEKIIHPETVAKFNLIYK